MRAIFKDAGKQEHFDRHGYAIISFLDAGQCAELLRFYESIDHGPISDSLYVSGNTERGEEFTRAIKERLRAVAAENVRQHFEDCRMITGSFLVKKPNPKNRVLPHQDWTTVDDRRYVCTSIWTALTDIDFDKGPLGTIAGSHRFFEQVLCSPSAYSYRRLPYAEHLAAVFPFMTFHPLRAGEAVVFDSRIIHGSLANVSSDLRMAASFGIVPVEATLYHHYLLPATGGERFESFEVDEDFFCRYNNVTLTALYEEGGRPEGLKSVGVSDLAEATVPRLSEERMIELMEAAGNVRDRSREGVDGRAIFGRA